ncbi:hypothetical protein Bca4012_090064 [Brassica carinata]
MDWQVEKRCDTCRQGNGGSVLVWAKPKRIENQFFTSFSFSLAVIEYAIELSSTAHLLPADRSPPDSITKPQISSRASPLDGLLVEHLFWTHILPSVSSRRISSRSSPPDLYRCESKVKGLTHDQSKCPISNGVKEEKGDGPSDEKPDQGGKALSYKGAVESKALETNSSGDVRRNSQHVSGKQDVKGKGVVYEGGKQVTSGKFGPGRRSKEQGRPTAKYIRNAGYLPPQELRDSYAMATGGLNGLRNQDFGAHLDPQQKLMLEAFKSGESGEASGSKACKALLFDNEIGEEGPRELLGDDQAATEVAATVENKDLKEENGMTLEIESKEDEVIGEMVAGLDEEDGLFELDMMEDGEEEAGLAQDVSAEVKSMEIEEAFSTDEMMEVAGEKDNQAAKKKAGKLMAAAMGGNAKKRLVQSLVSPRKKAIAKQGHKAGDKGPLPTKKALVKAKPDQD